MFDLYAEITDRMMDELNAGRIPWQKPWHGETALVVSHTTGKPYSFLNQMLLSFRPGEYITFKQCSDLLIENPERVEFSLDGERSSVYDRIQVAMLPRFLKLVK